MRRTTLDEQASQLRAARDELGRALLNSPIGRLLSRTVGWLDRRVSR